MHAVARNGPMLGLVLMLLALPGATGAVTAAVSLAGNAISSAASARPSTAYVDTAVVGRPAPDFTLPALGPGSDVIELDEYRGKVVYLDFWSSWCAPCRRSMPHLDALRQEFSRQDFEVVGVSVDALAADARRFLERVPVSYPVGLDAGGRAVDSFGVRALPLLLVIDRSGVVRRAVTGAAVEAPDELRATAMHFIEEREVQ